MTDPPLPKKTKLAVSTANGPEEEDEEKEEKFCFLDSPPHSIRTRLFKLSATESSWSEVLTVSNAIYAKRQEIEDYECQLSDRQEDDDNNNNNKNNKDNNDIKDRLDSLQRELFDWTWPARLSDSPYKAWDRLSNNKFEKERLLDCPKRYREAGWILLLRSTQSQSNPDWSELHELLERCPAMLRDPTYLRACLDKGVLSRSFFKCPVPTPAILADRAFVIQIVQRFPTFLAHAAIPPEFYTDRELFEATVNGIRKYSSNANVLCRFSESLRNDADLVFQTLCRLYRGCWSKRGVSFVGRALRDDKDFCLRVTEELSKTTDIYQSRKDGQWLRLLDRNHMSERLRDDLIVMAAFLRIGDVTENEKDISTAVAEYSRREITGTPEELQRHAAIVHSTCEYYPPAIFVTPLCPARSELESSVPFVVRLLKETRRYHFPQWYFMDLPQFIREDREVSLAAATSARHPELVHPQWGGCVDFWCDALRRTESDLDLRSCFEQIPLDIRDNPEIVNAMVRHPGIEFLCKIDHSIGRCLFEALLRRVDDRESLRECVRFARTVGEGWDASHWHQIPSNLWEDTELCLSSCCPGSLHSTAAFQTV